MPEQPTVRNAPGPADPAADGTGHANLPDETDLAGKPTELGGGSWLAAGKRTVREFKDDFLQDRAGLDRDRIGLFGVSLGGYYAARAAAYEKRLRAVVSLAAPYRLDLDWDGLPPQTRATFQARCGAKDDAEARARAAMLTLEEAVSHIDMPLLVVGSGHDTIAPAYHQERLANEVKSAELVLYPDGSHGVTNRAFESRSRMADWMAARLTA